MSLCRVKILRNCIFAVLAVFFSPLHAEEGKNSKNDEYFVGYTPLSPSVWDSFTQEPVDQSRFRDYLFREAYLVDANNTYLKDQGKMFTIPTDDLSSTQRRLLSPYSKDEEEKSRRDYAEAVSSVVVNKGVPEYMLQLLGLQKLQEGVKKIEKAVSVDTTISKVTNERHSEPWKFKSTFLPYQRSYMMGVGNGIWNWKVQGGYTTNKGDQLYSVISLRYGKFLQANTYQMITYTGYSTLSYFIHPNLSLTGSFRRQFKYDATIPDTLLESVGMNYIF